MGEPITPPRDCWVVLRAIASDTARWWTIYDLQTAVPKHTGETIARKARKLRKLGLLDWCKPVDSETGGRFIEYRMASPHGSGCKHDPDSRRPILDDPVAPKRAPVDQDEAGVLFDLPPSREAFERAGRARR